LPFEVLRKRKSHPEAALKENAAMDYIEFKLWKAAALLVVIFVVAVVLGYKEGLARSKYRRGPTE
jgi:hypothetical protein